MNIDEFNILSEYSKRVINYAYHSKRDKSFEKDYQISKMEFAQKACEISLKNKDVCQSIAFCIFIVNVIKKCAEIVKPKPPEFLPGSVHGKEILIDKNNNKIEL